MEQRKNNVGVMVLFVIITALLTGCGPLKQAVTIAPIVKLDTTPMAQVPQPALFQYYETKDQNLSNIENNGKVTGLKEIARVTVPCIKDSPYTQCGFDIVIYAKDSLHSGKQDFYFAHENDDGYYGPFNDDLENLINEAKAVPSSEDLEKSIIDQKDALYRGYDQTGRDLASGYPVVFTTTTDPAVRFTSMSDSGGDASHTTIYFINQSKQKILQIDTEVFGGDFGEAGDFTLSLNGGSATVIQREQDVDDKKREITYKGLLVNKKLALTFNNLIYKPTSILEFTVLGVSSDLTSTYFSDGLKQYSYNIVSNELKEIKELPSSTAKPIK